MDYFKEIELSISFGQRLVKYKKSILEKILSSMIDDNSKIQARYEQDRSYIADVVQALESGEGISHMYGLKNRLTVVGQLFFKNEFKQLKELTVR
jgi:ABC-type transport system involved in cytochrome c biogenesis ATPase subunit